MTAGPATVPSGGVSPALPRRRNTRGAQRTGWQARARVWASRSWWYLNKWFRQMLFVLTNPGEAFWEIKRVGDWGSVAFMLVLAITARMALMGFMSFHYIFQAVDRTNWNLERIMQQVTSTFTLGMTNFIYNGNPEDTSVVQESIRILLPFITWCLAHYAIAMIFYGEGGFKDICIAAAFSLTPFVLFSWPASLILTNATTLSERSLYYAVSWLINFWVIYLFFTHIRVIHDFTFKRTIATYALSLITVILIWALGALVYALTTNTYEFFYELFYELTTR
jgi:hypothetical protein